MAWNGDNKRADWMEFEHSLCCGERVGRDPVLRAVDTVIGVVSRIATLELAAMGRKVGLSLATLTEALNMSTAASRVSQVVLSSIVAGRPTTELPLGVMIKGVDEAVSLGMKSGAPMPLASIARGVLQIGVNMLDEDARGNGLLGLIESMAATRLSDGPGSIPAMVRAVHPADLIGLRVGYVGLGAMGAALARRLMLSRNVRVFDVRPQAMREIETQGAIATADLCSLARSCDVIMICVPTSSVVREVLFGNAGLLQGLSPGKIVIDQTTGDPAATRAMAAELQALGVALLDAPVSGGPVGAAAGTIAIMCSGPIDAYVRVRDVLESISPNIVYCGGTGNAQIVKLVKNALGACYRLITYEVAAMALRNGSTLAQIALALDRSSGWSRTSERVIAALGLGTETAKLRLELLVKDLALACQLGRSCGAPMLIANAVRTIVEAALNELGADANIDELARSFEIRAGILYRARGGSQ